MAVASGTKYGAGSSQNPAETAVGIVRTLCHSPGPVQDNPERNQQNNRLQDSPKELLKPSPTQSIEQTGDPGPGAQGTPERAAQDAAAVVKE